MKKMFFDKIYTKKLKLHTDKLLILVTYLLDEIQIQIQHTPI